MGFEPKKAEKTYYNSIIGNKVTLLKQNHDFQQLYRTYKRFHSPLSATE